MLRLVRRIFRIRRPGSTQTRDITTVRLTDPSILSNQPAVMQEVFDKTKRYAAVTGLDVAGVEAVEIPYVKLSTGDLCFHIPLIAVI
jgi:hypothetical protein